MSLEPLGHSLREGAAFPNGSAAIREAGVPEQRGRDPPTDQRGRCSGTSPQHIRENACALAPPALSAGLSHVAALPRRRDYLSLPPWYPGITHWDYTVVPG